MFKWIFASIMVITTSAMASTNSEFTPSCEMRVSTNNIDTEDRVLIEEILASKGYIDVGGPGYVGNGEWNFGSAGFLWIYAGVFYNGLGIPSHLGVDVSHSIYQEGYSYPVEVWTYNYQRQTPSLFNSNSQKVVKMVREIPNCDELVLETVDRCDGKKPCGFLRP